MMKNQRITRRGFGLFAGTSTALGLATQLSAQDPPKTEATATKSEGPVEAETVLDNRDKSVGFVRDSYIGTRTLAAH